MRPSSVGSQRFPPPGPGSVSSQAILQLQAFLCSCFFSTTSLLSFHLPLKEKKKKTVFFNAAIIASYFIFIPYFFNLTLKSSLHRGFSVNSCCTPYLCGDDLHKLSLLQGTPITRLFIDILINRLHVPFIVFFLLRLSKFC